MPQTKFPLSIKFCAVFNFRKRVSCSSFVAAGMLDDSIDYSARENAVSSSILQQFFEQNRVRDPFLLESYIQNLTICGFFLEIATKQMSLTPSNHVIVLKTIS